MFRLRELMKNSFFADAKNRILRMLTSYPFTFDLLLKPAHN